MTAFHSAVENQNVEIVKLLMKKNELDYNYIYKILKYNLITLKFYFLIPFRSIILTTFL